LAAPPSRSAAAPLSRAAACSSSARARGREAKVGGACAEDALPAPVAGAAASAALIVREGCGDARAAVAPGVGARGCGDGGGERVSGVARKALRLLAALAAALAAAAAPPAHDRRRVTGVAWGWEGAWRWRWSGERGCLREKEQTREGQASVCAAEKRCGRGCARVRDCE
jgi:hypothetical protein